MNILLKFLLRKSKYSNVKKALMKQFVLNRQTIICKIFDIWLLLQVHRISWARIFWGQQQAVIGRIGEGLPWSLSSRFHSHTFDSMQQLP